MMGQVYNYQELTMEELSGFNPEKTIFLMAWSPLEAHGPHLPLGTDVIVAEKMTNLYSNYLQENYPEYILVTMPTMALGADVLSRTGSIKVSASLTGKLLYSFASSLAERGFKYLFIADNHGGPRHLLTMEAIARKAYKKYGFYIINSFVEEFYQMMNANSEFLLNSGLARGSCGDLQDLHAGTNETSLMLALAPEHVRPNYKELEQHEPPKSAPLFKGLASLLRLFRGTDLADEVETLGSVASWSANENSKAYIGTPKKATKEAGERMLQLRLELASNSFKRALQGEAVHLRPPLWALRFLRHIP